MKKSNIQRSPPKSSGRIRGFVLSFTILYALLTVVPIGLRGLYGPWFRTLGGAVAAVMGSRVSVSFETGPRTPGGNAVTVLRLMDADPNAAGKQALHVPIDHVYFGYLPTALLIALVLATPISRRRRVTALLAGFLLVNLLIGLKLGALLINASTGPELPLLQVSPLIKELLMRSNSYLVAPLAPTFFGSALIWFLVSFRRGDLEVLGD